MITLITGVPGSGKTAFVVQMIMEELKKKRQIYSIGIPDLVASHRISDDSQPDGFRYFAVEDAGNPRTWQKGSWLKVQSYELPPENDDEFLTDEDVGKSAWVDNEHKDSGYSDFGSLVIIDEAQTFFRPRSSAAKVPDYIAAFEVHRHQGLDFWILTQRPNLLDGNLRGLVSRHIHIHTSSMGRKKIEWAECQNPDSRQARGSGHSVRYKPNPKVFDLYRSSQLHTKFSIKLPNTVYILATCFIILCLSVSFLYFDFSEKLKPKSAVASSVSSPFNHNSLPSSQPESLKPESLKPESLKPDSLNSESLKPEFAKSWISGVFFVAGRSPVVYLKLEDGRTIDASRVNLTFRGNSHAKLIDGLGNLYSTGSYIEIPFHIYENISPFIPSSSGTAILVNSSLSTRRSPPLSSRNWSYLHGLKNERSGSFHPL